MIVVLQDGSQDSEPPPPLYLCSEEQSWLAARKFARIVQKLGFPVGFFNFKIHNVVATWKTFPISLERLAHYQPCRSGDTGCGNMSHNPPPECSRSCLLAVFKYNKLMFSLAQRLDAGEEQT